MRCINRRFTYLLSVYWLTRFDVGNIVTDLTGSKDGTVRLWEWGHMECINEPRKPGAFPKVTKVLFNAQGNKVQHSAWCSWSDLYTSHFLILADSVEKWGPSLLGDVRIRIRTTCKRLLYGSAPDHDSYLQYLSHESGTVPLDHPQCCKALCFKWT